MASQDSERPMTIFQLLVIKSSAMYEFYSSAIYWACR